MYLSFSLFLPLCSLFFAHSFSVPLLSLPFSFTLLSYPFSFLSLFLIAFPFFLSVFPPPTPSPLFPLFYLTVSSSPSPLLSFFLPLSSPLLLPPPLFYPFPLLFLPLSSFLPIFPFYLTFPSSYSSPLPSTSSYPFFSTLTPPFLPLPLSFSLPLLLFLIPSHPGWPRIRGPSGAQCCFRRPREGRQNGPQLPLRQL